MTDATPDLPGAAQPPEGPYMRVVTQFVRDFSFENPRAPESLRLDARPELKLGVEVSTRGRADGLFEVDLKLSILATAETNPLFQIELLYGGLFQIGGLPDDAYEPTLMIDCPRYLFPFARQIVAASTSDGGFFPPLLLEPFDFQAVYAARRQAEGAPVVGQA